MKPLILYYSLEGNTKKVADHLAEKLNADIERIRPLKDINPTGGGRYLKGGSQVMMKKTPDIRDIKTDISNYDTILIGSPIWAGTFAPAIRTLISSGSLKGKNVAYFYTHLGGASKAEKRAMDELSIDSNFLGAFSCNNIPKNFDTIKIDIEKWAVDLLK